MAFPKTRERAHELVKRVATVHGELGEPRPELDESFWGRNFTISSRISTPARNHTSHARFLFELLNNADNNCYTEATALGEAPYVSFHVFRHRIVVECNEDGFTENDLKGICFPGRNAKTASNGHAGEKGIGFKSVFTAAWKAHIRSGHLSFSFSHMTGDLGVGTIVPRWEEPIDDEALPMTRITLHLLGTQGTENLDILCKIHDTIRRQLQELQDTTLLGTKKLKMIRIASHRIDGTEELSATYSIERSSVNHAVLTGSVVEKGIERKYVKHYHTTIHRATQSSKHDSHVYHGHVAHAPDVALAFPVSETSAPIIKPQDIISANSPVRSAGFTFIIHADLVTDVDKDIVKDSQHNIAQLDRVADAFCKAVVQFCEHPSLRFQWVKYLPDKNDKGWGALWLSLIDNIYMRLNQIPVLYCHRSHHRHRIEDLVRLKSDFCENGEPLLDGRDSEHIISQRYSISELNVLMNWGLKFADFGRFLDWLSEDLGRGEGSRMRSTGATDNWHSQTAKLLHEPFLKNWPKYKAKLKTMNLLPLEGGDWVSAAAGPIFFPALDGRDMPPHIGLSMVDKTITNVDRIRLFQDLGVREAPVSLVRSRILGIYGQPGLLPNISVQTSKQHLIFLYLTQHLKSVDEAAYADIVLFDRDERILSPFKVLISMFVTGGDPSSPWILLKGHAQEECAEYHTPAESTPHYFLHDAYFSNVPHKPPNQAHTWAQWLHVYLNISRYIRLGDRSVSGQLWGEQWQEHRPGRFLGALQVHIHQDSQFTPEFITRLQNTVVLCRGGQEILKNTFFPTRQLEEPVNRFLESCTFFPFLRTLGEIDVSMTTKWHMFLNKMGVGTPRTDLEFALHILRYGVRALRPGYSSLMSINRLFSLYSYIQAQHHTERRVGGEEDETIRKMFADERAICIPQSSSTENHIWASPKECVWSAVRQLKTKYALRIYYEEWAFFCGPDQQRLEQLFTITLGVPNCTLDTYVDELKSLKLSSRVDVKDLYREIDRLCRIEIEQGTPLGWLKDQFEDHELVCVILNDLPSWHRPSHCGWSSDTRLGDKVSLEQEYEEWHWLFVLVLGFNPLTLEGAVAQLNEAGCRRSVPVEEIKTHLMTVNAFLQTCSAKDAQQSKLNGRSRIFPVRYPEGGVKCVSSKTQFFIVDRESMRPLFEEHVRFFDFSLEMVIELEPFIRWAQIGHRYVSRCGKTFTSVQTSDAEPFSHPDLQFQQRAHAILRIAKHFKSPRVRTAKDADSLYELLRNAKIFATDAISLEVGLSQDGVLYKAPRGALAISLGEDGSNLTVYLPRRKIPQQHDFHKQLPERLIQWLMTERDSRVCGEISYKAIIVMKDIWNTPVATLSTTLDEWGIIAVSTPNLDPVVQYSSSESDSGVHSETSNGACSGSRGAMDGKLVNASKVVNRSQTAPDTPDTRTAGTDPDEDSSKSLASSTKQGAPVTIPVILAAAKWDSTKQDETLWLQ